jgi:hypothetical protein
VPGYLVLNHWMNPAWCECSVDILPPLFGHC